MKKAIQFMLLAALVVSVSGCANTNHPQAIRESSDIEALRSEIDENAVPKENSDSMQISASSLRNFLPKKTAVCGARFFMAFTPRTDKLFPLLSRRLAMWAVSRIGVGMALTAVWNGAPVLFRGRRMSAGILIVVLSRNLQAAQTACNGLRIEVNGLTTAPRRRRV